VPKYTILEVVSGLGVGGAEKAMLSRMKWLPVQFTNTILNVRPEIDALTHSETIQQHRVSRRGLLRFLSILFYLFNSNYDVIIVRTPLDAVRFSLCKSILRNKKRLTLVFEAHSNFVSRRPIMNRLLSILLQNCRGQIDLVVAVSENVKKGPLCVNLRNVEVVYLGAELEPYQSAILKSDSPKLLFVGRLVDIKRPIWLLERLRNVGERLSLQESTLTLVGDGPLKQELEMSIEIFGLKGVVDLIGYKENVSRYFDSATHLVSCSTNEGLPLTFYEAKLSGLSIIATPSGGGGEIFGPEDLELSSFDESEFEEALFSVLSSPPPSREMRRSVRSNSRWMRSELCAKRYYFLLSEQLENRV
jgi:glycosyltransferase involved in cell wall biosynthesis